MDPDTVIAVGSLVHDLLGLFGGIILSYFGYRLWMRRIKATPGEVKWNWKTATIFLKQTAPGTLFALLGSVQIWLTASAGLHGDGNRLAGEASRENSQAAVKSVAESPFVLTLAAGASRPDPANLAQEAGLASLIGDSGASGHPKQTASGSEAKSVVKAGGEKIRERAQKPGERVRLKELEKRRIAAEKKRSRLEEMYQNGTISSEAYQTGENEYRLAIQRYRKQVSESQVGPD